MEAWVSLLMCVSLAIFTTWLAMEAVSLALDASHPWIAVVAWAVFVVMATLGLTLASLSVIVALGPDLSGRAAARETDG